MLLAVVLASPTWALSAFAAGPSDGVGGSFALGAGTASVDAACCPLCPAMQSCLCGCAARPSDRMPSSPDRDPQMAGPDRVAIGGPEIEVGRLEWPVAVPRMVRAGSGPVAVRGPPEVCSVLCRWVT